MKIFIAVLKTKQGIMALATSFGGILLMYFGSKFLAGIASTEFFLFGGSIVSVIGTKTFCTMIVATRNAQNSSDDEDVD